MLKVVAEFEGLQIKPVRFWRGAREYVIERITMKYGRKDGGRDFLCFAIEAAGMIGELALDKEDLVWRLRYE